MDTNKTLHIVSLLADLKPFFRGIYDTNSLPAQVTQFPSAIVSNTDPLEEKGSHWVAFWFKSGTECEFYDSYGKIPKDYDNRLREFIDRNSFVSVYNNVQVQPDFTSSCGFHVLFFLYRRFQGFSMQNSIEMIDRVNPDDFVRHFVLNKINRVEKENQYQFKSLM